MGFFDRIKRGLTKTVQILNTDIRDLFKQKGRLADETFLNEMFEMFVKTDMGVTGSNEIVAEVRTQYRGRVVEMHDVLEIVKAKLKSLVAQPTAPIQFAEKGLTVIMVCGVNGSGKTTTIAKLTSMFVADGKKVVLGAADTFRAAAVEQLTIWAERLGAEIVVGVSGSDPASVAHKAIAKALEINADICIIDTAGRLQTQRNLMQELEKIRRVLTKQIPEAPHEVILILDATTGQNGISQAKYFTEAVKCTGIVLAKLDGTAKGGVVIAIRKQLDLPVKFIGVGESANDLALFDPNEFVDALFDETENTENTDNKTSAKNENR
ncbi:MAG: signal recognition particle-docking protein FtsY [Planctomycetaceae bacterium]|jgi:fused signal recognition particle receptor|nr:signal recognition particle-docking protein FtsY [Planctomycetaceae bacterium]